MVEAFGLWIGLLNIGHCQRRDEAQNEPKAMRASAEADGAMVFLGQHE